MKADIHPEYVEATVRCSCGNTFTTRATKPEIVVELCANCHPFYTGKQKLVDSGGRVERFRRRYEGKPKPSALKRPPEEVQEAEAEPLPETKAEAEQEPQTADDVASEQAPETDAAQQPAE